MAGWQWFGDCFKDEVRGELLVVLRLRARAGAKTSFGSAAALLRVSQSCATHRVVPKPLTLNPKPCAQASTWEARELKDVAKDTKDALARQVSCT